MATFVLTDCTVWIHERDVTTDSNELSVTVEVDAQDSTTFGGGGWRRRTGGLRNIEADLGGFWDDPVDATLFANLGVADHAVTISPTGVETSRSLSFQAGRFSYEQFGSVGDMTPFSLTMQGTNGYGVARGQIAKSKGTVTATGVLGSPVNVGAGGTGKYLYATVHAFDTAGTTVTVAVQSDDAQAFSTPTTQATFPAITTAGGSWLTRVAIPAVTDTWWRLNVTAITGTWTLGGSIAVQ